MQGVVELVTDYLEGALSATERERFDEHIAGCPYCEIYLEQMRQTDRCAWTSSGGSLLEPARRWTPCSRIFERQKPSNGRRRRASNSQGAASHTEERQVDRSGHGLLAGLVGMELIARVVERKERLGLAGSRVTLSKSITPSYAPRCRIHSLSACRLASRRPAQ